MTIHEFGAGNAGTIVMFHPLGVWWDIFEAVIPILERDYHLVVPAVPGFDPDRPDVDFTSVEAIASEMADWLIARGQRRVRCLYGCSMGGGVVARMLADGRVRPDCAVMDGGMTPYQLPKPVTWLIGARDWCMLELGKRAGPKLLRSVFDPEKYTEADLDYVRRVMRSMSARTAWRSFYSCNNYAMPRPVPPPACPVQYWYGDQEAKARAWDIAYIRKAFPAAQLVENRGQGHAEFFTLHPEAFCKQLNAFIEGARA